MADLTAADREALDGIAYALSVEEDASLVIAKIHAYYGDLDRADRTPRMIIYGHMGVLLGIATTCRDAYLQQQQDH